jgi:hypothetical protein
MASERRPGVLGVLDDGRIVLDVGDGETRTIPRSDWMRYVSDQPAPDGTALGTPIDGGYCVKRLDDGRCVDVMRMAFNWRVVVSAADPGPHLVMDHGYCYFGHGHTDDGRPRTMHGAFLAAMAAARVWDGTGDPPGHDKKVC